MSRTEDIAQDFRERTLESRPAQFISNLTPLRAIIGLGIGIMGIGIALLMLVTITVVAANLLPLNPLLAGTGSLLLALEGFGVVILSSEFVEA